MREIGMGVIESRFADIVWQKEPIKTKELVAICDVELNWARTTTYTVLKRLCERGIFQTKNSIVTSVLSRDEYYAIQSKRFVDHAFQGSLPAFMAAFSTKTKLSESEMKELHQMIDNMAEK